MIRVAIMEAPPLNLSEVRRYARVMGEDAVADALIAECYAEAEPVLSYKACYTELGLVTEGDDLHIGCIVTPSKLLKKALAGCERALLFAATVGAPYDRLIAKYSRLSPAKALVMQAMGAERAESLCDAFVRQYEAEHACVLKRRVSPGYGDIPLSMQREIFALLDCPRKIGLTLNESLLMSPSKSVTAIAGLSLPLGGKVARLSRVG